MKINVLIGTLLFFAFPAFGQAVDTAAVIREVDSLTALWNRLGREGQYELIVESAGAASEKVQKTIGTQNAAYAGICHTKGVTYRALGQYAEAEKCLSDAVAIREKILGKENPDYGSSINSLGTVYLDAGQYEKAEPLFEQALDIAEKVMGKESIPYASSLNNLGILYYYSGKYDKAEPYFLEVRSLKEKLLGRESIAYATSVENLANLYTDLGNYEQAERFYLEALGILEKVAGKKSANYAFAQTNLATLYVATSEYQKAELAALEALAVNETILGREHPDYASSLLVLSSVYLGMGRYEESIPLLMQCKAIREKTSGKESPDYANVLNDLAVVYHRLGDYEKTESYYLESLDFREKLLGKEHPEYAWSLNNLAVLYLNMGNYRKAEQFQLEALAIREKVFGKDHPAYAINLTNLAVVYTFLEKDEQAEQLYLQALKIKEKNLGKTHVEYLGAASHLASLYTTKGKHQEAISILLEVKNIFEQQVQNREHPYYLNCLTNLGNLYAGMKQYDLAESLLLESKSLNDRLHGENHVYFALSHDGLAELYWKTARPQLAAQSISAANTIRKYLLSRASRHLSEREMQAYIRTFEQNLQMSYSFAFKHTKDLPEFQAGCFDNTLFYKGFLLDASNQVRRLTQSNPQLAATFNLHRAALRRLEKEYAKPRAEQKSLAALEEEVNSLEKELATRVLKSEPDDVFRQISWRDVQSALQPHEAALEFIHFNYSNPERTDSVLYAALLLKPGMPHPLFIPLCEEKQLKALFPAAGVNINRDQVNELYGINPGDDKNALYHLLWAPLEKHLSGVRAVYYSPSGLLHRLNLSALPVTAQTTLSGRHDLVVLGSTRQLVAESSHTAPDGSPTALVYGDIQFNMDSTAYPVQTAGNTGGERGLSFSQTDSTLRSDPWNYLKWSEKEVDNVRAALEQAGQKTRVLKGWQATEESFKQIGQTGPSPRILHVSTHGYFFPDPQSVPRPRDNPQSDELAFKLSEHPMIRSGLILAGANHAWQTGRPLGNREDGILTAYEISQLDLRNTELVVLSACETGLGHIEGNEGVYGLQRAFKIAGAKTLVMSLWQVPDYETQELMTAFYQKWLTGKMPVRQALHAAQKEMRDKGYEPFYWAGFVVVE